MRNHDEKLENMSESVLPSTERERARRTRQAIHRQHRSRECQQLVAVRRDVEVADIGPEIERRRRQEIDWTIGSRRGAYKVGSLLRWARARVDADLALAAAPIDEQVASFRALLPDNTIGRHALQNIRWDLERRAGVGRWDFASYGPDTSARLQAAHRDRVAHQVRCIVAAGNHGVLNEEIRALLRSQEPAPYKPARPRRAQMCPRRFLLGADDVGSFADDVARYPCITEIVARVADRFSARPRR